jgi:hypothetical protein
LSVFDAPTTEQQNETRTASQTETQNQENWLEKVVAEKGDHWKDPQTLAKGYSHAQARIRELEALEEKYKGQDYAKTLLEQLQAKQATQEVTPKPATEEPKSDTEIKDHTSLSPEDIERLLEKTLSARDKQKTVEEALTSKFGSGANKIVHDRAKELGLSIEKMKEIANESPAAFLRLVGEPDAKQTNAQMKSTVNTSGFNSNSGERGQPYYSNLRRTNRKLYDSLQNQMLNDRIRLGDKFYTN